MAGFDQVSHSTAHVIATTGTNTVNVYLRPPAASGKFDLEGIYLEPGTAVSTDGSNYLTVTFKKGASGSTNHGTLTTNSSGGVALVAGTKAVVTLSGSASKSYDAATTTDCIEAAVTKTGTGATIHGTLVAMWRRVRD